MTYPNRVVVSRLAIQSVAVVTGMLILLGTGWILYYLWLWWPPTAAQELSVALYVLAGLTIAAGPMWLIRYVLQAAVSLESHYVAGLCRLFTVLVWFLLYFIADRFRGLLADWPRLVQTLFLLLVVSILSAVFYLIVSYGLIALAELPDGSKTVRLGRQTIGGLVFLFWLLMTLVAADFVLNVSLGEPWLSLLVLISPTFVAGLLYHFGARLLADV